MRSIRRLSALAIVPVLLLSLGVVAQPVASAAADPAVDPALPWIEQDLTTNGSRLPSSFDPTSPEAAYNQGVALRSLGRDEEAIEPFESAARLEPAYAPDCLAELGAILAERGDAAGARAKLDEALRLAPEHAAALRYRAALDGR